MSALPSSVLLTLPTSPFPPLAVRFMGLGTGYLIYGTQELLGFPRREERVDLASGAGASGCPASCSSWPGPTCSSG
jgi:hypothetical protein